MHPRIAITVGDPRGIGPEIVSKVLQDPPAGPDYLVIGPEELTSHLPFERIHVGECAAEVALNGEEGPVPAPYSKLPAREAGIVTALQIEKAVTLALDDSVQAIVTGPAQKHALHLAGYSYPGHTEWLGELAGGVETAMMLVAGALRVVLVTTHIALHDVPASITTELVVRKGVMTRTALKEWWGIEAPRLAVCALNPHAGEGGLFGDEDREILEPAVHELDAVGPIPADTAFVRALRGEFHAVLAPYHDVGMTAVKVAGFGKGVNVTLGLPFVRTAPDHGTALDIAGKGIADAGSMREAVVTAARFVTGKGR
jgi:4-hydroxythreonine-4-phosphate dehydrogenase